jgi:D-alanine--poly(phosphoribitol) ligase subunit 2
MEDQVMAILNEICGAEEGELEPDMNLFELGLLDSFGVVQLLVALEERLGAALDLELLTREEIATPARIALRVQQAGGKSN